MYGLKQAPRTWHIRLDQELSKIGLHASKADAGLYTVNSNDNAGNTYVLVYVDDLLITAPEYKVVASVKSQLQSTFDARDLGEAELFLGITITRDRQKKTIKLHQGRLITQMLGSYGLGSANPRATPFSAGLQLSADEGVLLTPEQATVYRELVGKLLYLSNCTRPDIAYAAGVLARYMANPTAAHWTHWTRLWRATLPAPPTPDSCTRAATRH